MIPQSTKSTDIRVLEFGVQVGGLMSFLKSVEQSTVCMLDRWQVTVSDKAVKGGPAKKCHVKFMNNYLGAYQGWVCLGHGGAVCMHPHMPPWCCMGMYACTHMDSHSSICTPSFSK